MTPEQKAKLLVFLKGMALAALTAAFAYASTHWKDVFGAIPFGAAVGFAAGITAKYL